MSISQDATGILPFSNKCPKDECFEGSVNDVCGNIEQSKIVFFNYYNDNNDGKVQSTYIGKYKECDKFMKFGVDEIHLTETFKINGNELEKTENEGSSDGIARFVFDRIEKTSFIYDYAVEIKEGKKAGVFTSKTEDETLITINDPSNIAIAQNYKDQFLNIYNEYLQKVTVSDTETTPETIPETIPEMPTEPATGATTATVAGIITQPQPEVVTNQPLNSSTGLTDEEIIKEIIQENPKFKKFASPSNESTKDLFKDSNIVKFGLMYSVMFDKEINELKDKSKRVITDIKSISSEPDKIVDKTPFDNIQQKFKQIFINKKLDILNSNFNIDLYAKFKTHVSDKINGVFDELITDSDEYIDKSFEENKIRICYYVVKNFMTKYLRVNKFLNEDKELTPPQIKTLLKLSRNQFIKLFDLKNFNTIIINKKPVKREFSDESISKFKSQGWLFVGKVISFTKDKIPTTGFSVYINNNGEIVTHINSDHKDEINFTRKMGFKLFHNYKTSFYNERLDIPIIENVTMKGGMSRKTRKIIRKLKTKKQQTKVKNNRRSMKM